MCGIVGIVTENAERYKETLDSMLRTLAQRGPDSTGRCFFSNCILGHMRLSIVDLNSGTQPMLAEQKKLAISFNGEIYGYRGIRESLSEYLFETASDTEVILALYTKYGSAMMSSLPGMFSFAIWDENEQALFCARDRFGEKPFFFSIGEKGEFIFASEIKALIASDLIKPVLRKSSLAHYLRRGYVYPTHTIYSNIYTLPPAHSLKYKNGTVKIERYWHLPDLIVSLPFMEAVEEFKELLTRAVQRQLVADVDIGAFLSGGIDSTTIVAIASQQYTKLKTYTFGYQDRSELPYAEVVAKRCDTDHMELIEKDQDIADLLIKMQLVYDEPFYDSAMIPTYLMCKMASQHGKVVLTGDGADELLGGYPWWYYRCLNMEKAGAKQSLPGCNGSDANSVHNHYSHTADHLEGKEPEKFLKGLQWGKYWDGTQDINSFSTIMRLHLSQSSILSDDELSKLGLDLYSDDAATNIRSWKPSNTTDDALKLDIEDYLAGDLLVKTDRASMAHSLELRSPFLDVELASFCISLPLNMKITMGNDKRILREAFSSYWPNSVKDRSKQGFGAPLNRWLQQDSVRLLKHEYLDNPRRKIFQLIPYEATHQLLLNGDAKKIWMLLVLALWVEMHTYEI